MLAESPKWIKRFVAGDKIKFEQGAGIVEARVATEKSGEIFSRAILAL